VSASGTTDIEIGPRFTARVSALGLRILKTLAVNLGPISISVVPDADTLAVNIGPISIASPRC
jgi:hypothetical protein